MIFYFVFLMLLAKQLKRVVAKVAESVMEF